MKHQAAIDRIRANRYTRSDLKRMRTYAESKLRSGDQDAQAVLDAIDQAAPIDDYIVFMGFCPAADMSNRLDLEWKKTGTCTFSFLESERQLDRFNNIWAGDLIVLKKRQVIGKSMKLFGHGRVTGVKFDPQGKRYLLMDWAPQEQVIEVPLMGCNSTVDVKTAEQVAAEMPKQFYDWLKEVKP